MDLRKIILEELDKMSSIDLNTYYKKQSNNKEWLEILSKFPEMFQREIIDERPKGDKQDIDEIKNWRLKHEKPIEVSLKTLLTNKDNLETISRTPQKVIDKINKSWGTDVKQTKVYDQNPNRYFKYAEFRNGTEKPSTMINGIIVWGVGRFISSLLRWNKTIKVWDIRDD